MQYNAISTRTYVHMYPSYRKYRRVLCLNVHVKCIQTQNIRISTACNYIHQSNVSYIATQLTLGSWDAQHDNLEQEHFSAETEHGHRRLLHHQSSC